MNEQVVGWLVWRNGQLVIDQFRHFREDGEECKPPDAFAVVVLTEQGTFRADNLEAA